MALDRAEKWFNELEIRTIARPTCLMVNRQDITSLCSAGTCEDGYDAILKELKSALNSSRFYWTGRDDEWLYLDTL